MIVDSLKTFMKLSASSPNNCGIVVHCPQMCLVRLQQISVILLTQGDAVGRKILCSCCSHGILSRPYLQSLDHIGGHVHSVGPNAMHCSQLGGEAWVDRGCGCSYR